MKNDKISNGNMRKASVLDGKKAIKHNLSLVIISVILLFIIFIVLKALILPGGITETKEERIAYEKPADLAGGTKTERQKEIKLEMIAWGFLTKSLPWLFSIIVLSIVLTTVLVMARRRRESEEVREAEEAEQAKPESEEEQSVVEVQPTSPTDLDELLRRTNETLKKFESEIKRI